MKQSGGGKGSIDWEQVRIRLASSQSALQEALNASPHRIETVYRQRAAKLASSQGGNRSISAGLPVLIFWLGEERYAIELKDVDEVLPFGRCTPVPGSPTSFLGVIHLRGELLAVLDLGRLLALPETEHRTSEFVFVVRRAGKEIGLRVDRIEELCEVRSEEVAPSVQGSYVKRLASSTVALLDVDQVLAEAFSKQGVLTT